MHRKRYIPLYTCVSFTFPLHLLVLICQSRPKRTRESFFQSFTRWSINLIDVTIVFSQGNNGLAEEILQEVGKRLDHDGKTCYISIILGSES